MPQNEIANLTFDIMDFIEDDPEALKAFESILDEAVEEWLEASGYEDWDVDDWDDIDTTITISGLRLSPEPDDDDIDEDEEV